MDFSFEWDPRKAGVSFEEVIAVFGDPLWHGSSTTRIIRRANHAS